MKRGAECGGKFEKAKRRKHNCQRRKRKQKKGKKREFFPDAKKCVCVCVCVCVCACVCVCCAVWQIKCKATGQKECSICHRMLRCLWKGCLYDQL